MQGETVRRAAKDQYKPAPEPWPKSDEIRWVQWRIRERRALEEGTRAPDGVPIKGGFKLSDYQTWLLRQTDGFLELSSEAILYLAPATSKIQLDDLPLSFQSIGDLLFPHVQDQDNRKKRAADAFNRVESEFGRGSLKKKTKFRPTYNFRGFPR